MSARVWTRLLWVTVLVAGIWIVGGLARAGARISAGRVSQSDAYQRALVLGTEAYVYGYPLLDTERVFRASTSTNVPNGAGAGPVNQFSHIRRLASPLDRTVVAPNHDTLYSMAWLDLRRQPVVVHMPVVRGRFAVMELLDPYTENFASIGSVGHPPGNYAVVAPGWNGQLPRGVREIRSPYSRVWIIGRTYIRDAADTANVVHIQMRYSVTPLSRWGSAYVPARPRHIDRIARKFTVPGTVPDANPLAFFDALGDELRRFPPPAADRSLLANLRRIGVGPGLHPSTDLRLSPEIRRGLHDAVAAGAAQVSADVRSAFVRIAPSHNGWLVSRTGTYGTDYATRAIVDAIGLGAPVSSLAMYPFTVTDLNLHPLTGANRYVTHVAARDLPFPVKAFWSMTLYDAKGFFVPNRAHVYLVNNRSHVHFNPDHSLDIYIQPNAPTRSAPARELAPLPCSAARSD